MQKIKLSTKQEIDVREIWEKEDTDFTPWLAKPENILNITPYPVFSEVKS